jgi:hypothetical protein
MGNGVKIGPKVAKIALERHEEAPSLFWTKFLKPWITGTPLGAFSFDTIPHAPLGAYDAPADVDRLLAALAAIL